eukprot:767348-Hanusia_phi.AAC.2
MNQASYYRLFLALLLVLYVVSSSGEFEAEILISSSDAFFEATQDVLVIRPKHAPRANLAVSVRLDVIHRPSDNVEVYLDRTRLISCQEYPCEVLVQDVGAGYHKITASFCGITDFTCGPVIRERIFHVKYDNFDILENMDKERGGVSASLFRANTITSVELKQIELLEYQDYITRQEEGMYKLQCMDLCEGTKYLPDQDFLEQHFARINKESNEVYRDIFSSQFPQHADPWDVRPSASPMSGFGVTVSHRTCGLVT